MNVKNITMLGMCLLMSGALFAFPRGKKDDEMSSKLALYKAHPVECEAYNQQVRLAKKERDAAAKNAEDKCSQAIAPFTKERDVQVKKADDEYRGKVKAAKEKRTLDIAATSAAAKAKKNEQIEKTEQKEEKAPAK